MTAPGLGGNGFATLTAVTFLTACSAQAIRPPTSTIEAVGLIAEERFYADRIWFRLEGGQTWEPQTGTYRIIMNWGTKLLVAGSDATGRWLATLGPQGGLPKTCYFTPERGTEWGDGIAIAGVLFPKAPGFSFDSTPGVGSDYPLGTRFCFNINGQIASAIAN
jgi:hypothetical protein